MTDSFEDWIKGMTDNQYDDWLENKATEAQEEKALNIREPPNQEELEAMRRAQEYQQPEQSQREIDVGDNRDLPPVRRNVDIIMPPTGNAPIRIEPTTTPQPTTIQYPQVNRIPQPQIQPRPNRTTRIKSFFSRLNPFKKARK